MPDPAVQAQATALIRHLEADGCIFHDEWYPEPGIAKLKYTSESDKHDQMWEIEVRPWAGWTSQKKDKPEGGSDVAICETREDEERG